MTTMDAIERVRNLELELDTTKRQAGRALRSARRKLRLTLKQVAECVDGVSPATVHNTEKNKAWKTKTAAKLARFYDQSPA